MTWSLHPPPALLHKLACATGIKPASRYGGGKVTVGKLCEAVWYSTPLAWPILTVEVAGFDRADGLVEAVFAYNIDFTLDSIRPSYRFDVTCQGSVLQAIRAFF